MAIRARIAPLVCVEAHRLRPQSRRPFAVPAGGRLLAAIAALVLLLGCGRDEAPPGTGSGPPAAAAPAAAGTASETRHSPPAGEAIVPPEPARVPPTGTRVALVIDDLGQRLGGVDGQLLELPVPLTVAVLPGRPHSRAIAARVGAGAGQGEAARRELYLHLPMQPEGYPQVDPGPDALLVGLDPGEVAARLDRALASVPGAIGVNNHMGSAATADTLLMASLMTALRARGLRFLDSLTTPHSVAWRAARQAGVPWARNRLFLDVDHTDEAAVTARLAELVSVARHSGQAIGIAHPHAASAAVLAREIPRYQEEGVSFVTVSELTAAPAAAVAQATGAGDGR